MGAKWGLHEDAIALAGLLLNQVPLEKAPEELNKINNEFGGKRKLLAKAVMMVAGHDEDPAPRLKIGNDSKLLSLEIIQNILKIMDTKTLETIDLNWIASETQRAAQAILHDQVYAPEFFLAEDPAVSGRIAPWLPEIQRNKVGRTPGPEFDIPVEDFWAKHQEYTNMHGYKPTQLEFAHELNIGERALRNYLRRRKISWRRQ
jgi:hypothetical protein